jgi:hypothetical protein
MPLPLLSLPTHLLRIQIVKATRYLSVAVLLQLESMCGCTRTMWIGKMSELCDSHIWNEDHGFKLVRQGCDDTFYYCKRCADHGKPGSLFIITRGNSSVVSHWKTKHQIDQNGNIIKPVGNIGKQLTGQGKKEGEGKVHQFRLDLKLFRLLLIMWIAHCHIAFRIVENAYFLALIRYLNSNLVKLIPGRKTIRRWVIAEYHRRKRILRRELKHTRSKISISFDLWSSPNSLAVIAINAHFIDQAGTLKTRLLGLREVYGEHTGENQASVILKVFKEYRIRRNIGCLCWITLRRTILLWMQFSASSILQ